MPIELQTTDVLKRPIVSEKSVFLGDHKNSYTFEVDLRADKQQIRKAIEEIYKVHVVEVRTVVVPGKPQRTRKGEKKTSEWKKAVVQVHENDKIDVY